MEKRVVITGLGAITPLGNNVKETWEGIKNCKNGVDKITLFDVSDFKVKLAGEVKDFNSSDYIDAKKAKRMDRVSQFAVVAAKEAFEDSGITEENTDLERVGVVVGTGIGGLETIENNCKKLFEYGPDRISPMYIPMSIVNMPAGNIALELGVKGESYSAVTACASATH